MIDAIEIKNFRGIQRLKLEGLGRVNLLIGGNGCGKTTVAAACVMADDVGSWCFISPFLQDARPLRAGTAPADALRRLHPGLLVDLEPALTVRRGGGEFRMRLRAGEDGAPSFRPDTAPEIPFVRALIEPKRSAWVPAFVESEETQSAELIEAYKRGTNSRIVAAVQQVNPTVLAIDVPGSEVFVRLAGMPLPMPIGVLGDGALRVLDVALALGTGAGRVGIDELENGFHHSTLPKVIAMLRTARPEQQIFVTTHREELIVQACEQFIAENDDGLRIIRIDLREGVHSAQVYTAEQALAGIDAGLEIRG